MPSYTYRAVDAERGCGGCHDGFSTVQMLSDPPLAECPGCGAPVQRVVGGAVCVTKQRWNTKKLLSDDNLRAKGFKKMVKDGDGKYRDALAR